MEVPIEIQNGFGPFQPAFARLTNKSFDENDPWKKTYVRVSGIPKSWKKPVKKLIWFDGIQFAFQNYKQGNLTAEEFEDLKNNWQIDLQERQLSSYPIKCFVNIAFTYDSLGVFRCIVDTNNNYDFSDDTEFTPANLDWEKINEHYKGSLSVESEVFYRGKIVKVKTPILIVRGKGQFLEFSIPQHAEAKLKFSDAETIIKICSASCTSTDYTDPSIIEYDEAKGNKTVSHQSAVGKGQYLLTNAKVLKNIGVDVNQHILKLVEVKDSIYFSNKLGFKAPLFSGKEIFSNKEFYLRDLIGKKIILLDFWAVWCAPCVKEISNLEKLYNSIDKSKIEIVGVSWPETPEAVNDFIKRHNMTWPQLISDNQNQICEKYNVRALPSSYLIDLKGNIIALDLRGLDIEQKIEKAISQTK